MISLSLIYMTIGLCYSSGSKKLDPEILYYKPVHLSVDSTKSGSVERITFIEQCPIA